MNEPASKRWKYFQFWGGASVMIGIVAIMIGISNRDGNAASLAILIIGIAAFLGGATFYAIGRSKAWWEKN